MKCVPSSGQGDVIPYTGHRLIRCKGHDVIPCTEHLPVLRRTRGDVILYTGHHLIKRKRSDAIRYAGHRSTKNGAEGKTRANHPGKERKSDNHGTGDGSKPPRRWRWWWIMMAALLLGAIIAGGIYFLDDKNGVFLPLPLEEKTMSICEKADIPPEKWAASRFEVFHNPTTNTDNFSSVVHCYYNKYVYNQIVYMSERHGDRTDLISSPNGKVHKVTASMCRQNLPSTDPLSDIAKLCSSFLKTWETGVQEMDFGQDGLPRIRRSDIKQTGLPLVFR